MDKFEQKLNNNRIGIRAECQTCGWKSEIFRDDLEGSKEFANLSVRIETRLGHLSETAENINGKTITHYINFVEIF